MFENPAQIRALTAPRGKRGPSPVGGKLSAEDRAIIAELEEFSRTIARNVGCRT